MRRTYFFIILIAGLIFVLIGGIGIAPSQAQGNNSDLQNGELRRSTHAQTGMLTFLGADPRSPVAVPSAQNPGLTPSNRGIAILNTYGREFGLQNAAREIRPIKGQ